MSTVRLTTKEFIARSKKVYGNRYLYDKTTYANKRTKVIITCRLHGDFYVLPLAHTSYNVGCTACTKARWALKDSKGKIRRKGRSSFKIFSARVKHYNEYYIRLAEKKHNYKYKYLNKTIKGCIEKDKFTIICKDHGVFTQRVKNHIEGQGCPKCGKIQAHKSNTNTVDSFIKKAVKIHDNKYTYTTVNYINTNTSVNIICNTCFKTFSIKPNAHIQGNGCPYCRGMYKTTTDVKAILKKHHSELVLLPQVIKNSNTEILFYCKKHGIQSRVLKDLSGGRGCYKCSKGGFRVDKPGILYYISINKDTAYKIGVTNQTLYKRFSKKEIENIKIIRTWYYEDGQECYDKEQEILKKYKKLKYTGNNLIASGNTELFKHDVLNLDIKL